CKLIDKPEDDVDLGGGDCPSFVMPNARGAGYYHFALAPADLKKLVDKGLPKLTGPERYSLGASVKAAFARGAMTTADAAHALEKLTSDGDPSVSTLYGAFLQALEPWLRGTDEDPKIRALAAKTYRPIFGELGFDAKKGAKEAPSVKERRAKVIETLAAFAK